MLVDGWPCLRRQACLMKEGINFAQTRQKGPGLLDKLLSFDLKTVPLNKVSVGLGVSLGALLILNLAAIRIQKNYLNQKNVLNQSLESLKQKEEILLAVVQSQKDLEFIKTQKISFTPKINQIKDGLPEDTVLTFLSISKQKMIVSAQTPTGLSFSQFIVNLIGAKACQQLNLTQSIFVQQKNTFNFSLECLLTI